VVRLGNVDESSNLAYEVAERTAHLEAKIVKDHQVISTLREQLMVKHDRAGDDEHVDTNFESGDRDVDTNSSESDSGDRDGEGEWVKYGGIVHPREPRSSDFTRHSTVQPDVCLVAHFGFLPKMMCGVCEFCACLMRKGREVIGNAHWNLMGRRRVNSEVLFHSC